MNHSKSSSNLARSPGTLGIALLALVLAVIPTGGCQRGEVENQAGPQEAQRLIEEAQRLIEEAGIDPQRDVLEAAYGHLKRVRVEYPESPQSEVAFDLATLLWQQLWFLDRYTRPDSAWRTSEPEFLFDWLASYFEGAEEFPREKAEALLRSMPWSFYQSFLAYARTQPELSRWSFQAEDDNGRIRSVTGERAKAPAG